MGNGRFGNKKGKRYFRLAGTGHPLGEDYLKIINYVSTFQIENLGLVFHLFEIKGGD